MSKQFEQIKLLYNQIFTVSNNVKLAIENNNYDEALNLEQYKSQLVSRVVLAKKTVQLSQDEKNVIEDLKNKILLQEKENLNKIQSLRDETFLELKKLNSQDKVSSKYEQIEVEEGTICDYTSD